MASSDIVRETLELLIGPWLGLAALGGVLVLVLRKTLPPGACVLPARRRPRRVPWFFGPILAAAALWVAIPELTAFWLVPAAPLSLTGRLMALPADLAARVAQAATHATPLNDLLCWVGVTSVLLDELVITGRRALFAAVLASLLQLAVVAWFTVGTGRKRLLRLGLTTYRWPQNLIVAYLFWLLLTPLVHAIHVIVVLLFGEGTHGLEMLLRLSRDNVTWGLAVLHVLLLAPVSEELLFRGVLQSWMMKSPPGADAIVLGSLIAAVVMGLTGTRPTGPILFLVTVGPGYLAFERLVRRWIPQRGAARAIYASSLLFAAVHALAWPQPVPLFFLALGLGFLAYRTRSLLAPIIVHSLFNAVTMIHLILRQTAAH